MRQFFWIALTVGLLFLVGCRNEPAAENIQLLTQPKIDPNPKATGTGWMSDLVGNDEPPAVFRGLKMGDPEAKFELVPGLHRVEPDSGEVYFRIDSVNGIGGVVHPLFEKGKLEAISIMFRSLDTTKIENFNRFLVNRMGQYYRDPYPPKDPGDGMYSLDTRIEGEKMRIIVWKYDSEPEIQLFFGYSEIREQDKSPYISVYP